MALMAGRLEIQDYGDKVVLRGGASAGSEGTVVTLTPSPEQESVEATHVFHRSVSCTSRNDTSALAFVGTNCGVFVVDTRTGNQLAQLLGNKRDVRCFQAVRDTLYVGVHDTTEPIDSNFGLWAIDMSAITAHPIKKVGDWEVVEMTLNSKQSQMAITYCQNLNGSYWFEVHLFGVNENGGIEYQERIGGDGWGKVQFSEDDTKVIIDVQEFPIPSQFLLSSASSSSAGGAVAAPGGAVAAPGGAVAAPGGAVAAPGGEAVAVKTTLGKRERSGNESRGEDGEDGDKKSEKNDDVAHDSSRVTKKSK
jgi:hypothetical protein